MTTELRTKTTGKARTAPRRQTVRKARFDVRMTDESKELLMKAAALRNVNLSDFILGSAQREAEQVLAAHHTITLSERDSRLFVDALAQPQEPDARERQVAQDYLARYHPDAL